MNYMHTKVDGPFDTLCDDDEAYEVLGEWRFVSERNGVIPEQWIPITIGRIAVCKIIANGKYKVLFGLWRYDINRGIYVLHKQQRPLLKPLEVALPMNDVNSLVTFYSNDILPFINSHQPALFISRNFIFLWNELSGASIVARDESTDSLVFDLEVTKNQRIQPHIGYEMPSTDSTLVFEIKLIRLNTESVTLPYDMLLYLYSLHGTILARIAEDKLMESLKRPKRRNPRRKVRQRF